MNVLLVTLVNTLVVAITVAIHYEALHQISTWLPRLKVRHRLKIVVALAGAMLAHILEVWVFAFAYYLQVIKLGWGELTGAFNGTLMDCFYFSFTNYTTLGYGDIQPFGSVRYLTGVESLTGLVLITWTA